MLKRTLSTLQTATNSNTVEQLQAACKAMERRYERELDADLPFIIRLDGVNFKRFTAPLHKPFDPHFTTAMLQTARDLFESFAAVTAFVQSDEVSVFVVPRWGGVPFSGRCQKIASVAAGIASVRFNRHFGKLVGREGELGSFDARCFSCVDEGAMVQVAAWRHLHDCRRNAVNSAAAANFSHSSLQHQPMELVIERLAKERNINFHTDYPKEAIYGAFLKKIAVEHRGHNPVTGQTVMTTRYRTQARAIDFGEHRGDVFERVLLSRYWEADHPTGHIVPFN